MILYGKGVLTAPRSTRVVHDFADGPFETVNPELIQEAKRLGFSTTPPEASIVEKTVTKKVTK
jgi:hypothetical protein